MDQERSSRAPSGGDAARRLAAATAALHDCHLCGNDCGIDRTQRAGPCGIADTIHVASYGPHHGEEDVLRGRRGSGTIFFTGCNLHCVYCQNYDISQQSTGFSVDAAGLARIMLALEARCCHNINLVSPTHVASLLVPALVLAKEAGLAIPIVYNTGGYDAPQALALMDGLVDIYMPDMKYGDAAVGLTLSAVADYPEVNQAAVREMHRQVGDLLIDDAGIAQRGLLVRHLVLPGGLAGTDLIVRFLAQEISTDTYINIMAQYRPAYRARACATSDLPLGRRPTSLEITEAYSMARAAGLHRFDSRF
ncbi:MAG: 4Fe-4S cluster-binding domain-containing protein [Anaerolineae bacterium]|nr:4Fe-4S cluster-binding domain-containing protein [Anaerolineae bacterium]